MGKDKIDRYSQDQNPLGAVIGGVLGVLLSSLFWALVVSVYKLEINILAIAVGFIVGCTVRTLGKGVSTVYGVIGVLFTAAGCLSGRVLSILVINSNVSKSSIISQLMDINMDLAYYYLQSTFKTSDLIFYVIALFAGYYSSFRK